MYDSAKALSDLDIVVCKDSALANPISQENWQTSFNIDLMHTVRACTTAIPYFEQSDSALIIHISSISG